MNQRRRILIVSYLFPQMGGIAVQRALSLAKYLPGCGFQVHVLTAKNAAGPVYDPGLLKNVPDAVTIHHATTPEVPFRLRQAAWKVLDQMRGRRGDRKPAGGASKQSGGRPFPMSLVQRVLCPEPEILWVPFAVRAAKRIVSHHQIDCILVTAPPFSAFLVGNALKRENPRLTLISDFRDEWLTSYLNNNIYQNNPYARKRAPEIERATVELSDLVVAVNDSSIREIRGRYPEQPGGKFICVPNGYDPDMFAGFTPRSHDEPHVLITHSGSVYPNTSPRYYRQALEGLPEEVRRRIKTRFVGRVAEEERAFLADWPGGIETRDFLPQAEAIRLMEQTDYLLLTMSDPLTIPGKLYEYLATGKPIIAVTPKGSEVWRFFQDVPVAWRLDIADPQGNAKFLEELIGSGFPSGLRVEGRPEAMHRYSRANLAREYAGWILGKSSGSAGAAGTCAAQQLQPAQPT